MARADSPLARALADQGRSQVWLAGQLTERLGRRVGRNRVWEWVQGVHPEKETREAIVEVLGRTHESLWPELEIAERAG